MFASCNSWGNRIKDKCKIMPAVGRISWIKKI
jgi:hypothetical protein